MAEPILCVSWNNYANELATVCKSLLEKDFLVDCTIAAEGQSLKAHRLILSACSPYFCMLFSGEREKHPIVILKDTLFDTLKKVIDFVYYGKAEIPANQLSAFLELAVSLQIKGLNTSLPKNGETNIGGNVDGNICHNASSVNEDISEGGSSCQNCEPSSSNSSRQHHYHQLHPDTNQRDSPVSFDERRNSCEVPLQDPLDDPLQDRCPEVHNDSGVSMHTELSVKREALDPEIEIIEIKNIIEGDELGEASCRTFQSEMNVRPAPSFEQDLNQSSCGTESRHANESSALIRPLKQWKQWQENQLQQRQQSQQKLQQLPQQKQQHQQLQQPPQQKQQHQPLQQPPQQKQQHQPLQQPPQQMQQLQHQQLQQPREQLHLSQGKPPQQELQGQQFTHSSYDLSLLSGLAKPPELALPASEQSVGEESREFVDAHEVYGNDTNDVTSQKCGQNLTPSTSAEGPPEEQPEDQTPAAAAAAEPRLHVRLRRKSDGTFTSCREQRQRSGPQPFLSVDSFLDDSSLDAAPEPATTLAAERPHSCDTCGKNFTKACALTLHMHWHKAKRLYPCDVCGKAFATRVAVAVHKRWHKREGAMVGTSRYACDVCGKAFSTPAAVGLHRRWHKKTSYSCDVCGKAFTKAAALAIHKARHKGETSSSSDVSGEASPKAATHKGRHKEGNTHLCDLCGKAFANSTNLLIHMRTHTGERPYVCDVCGRGFSQSGTLKVHKRLHTGERPYQCDVCGMAFAQSTALSCHKRKHGGDRPNSLGTYGKTVAKKYAAFNKKRMGTKQRACTCEVCGKTFAQAGSVTTHMRLHTGERPYKCDLCGKAYAHSSNLNVHMRTHTGERPYPCDMCGKAFTNSAALQYHKRRFHTGERPFGCDACSSRFFLKSTLISHWQQHHASPQGEQCQLSLIPRE